MCGIAGFIEKSGRPADRTRLTRMTDCIAYRGPDDVGAAFLDSAALGHRRLSIVDVSPTGHQPMQGTDDRVWIVYNGELYNHQALRETLPPMPPYRGTSDTEVLVRALEAQGASILPRLNGIFAFALLDLRKKQLLLVRDQFGVKPLYYAEDAERFYFASEVKSILAAGLPAEFEPLAALDLTFTGWTTDERTLLRGIRRLPPGSFLRYDLTSGKSTVEKWYRPAPDWLRAEALGKDQSAWTREVRQSLELAVERQLMSDVPVGSFCSGGVDSSLVSAIAARRKTDIMLFNVACPDAPEVDEGPWAQKVAKHLGLDLETFVLTRQVFRESLVHAVNVTEYPLSFLNTVPLYLLSRLARNKGVKVLLSGEGADECFGGYINQFRPLALRHVARSAGTVGQRVLERGIAHVTRVAERLGMTWQSERGLGMHQALTGGLRNLPIRAHAKNAYERFPDPLDRALGEELLYQLQAYLLPILHRTDRASMAASVEARVPFLDPELVGLVLAMPPVMKIGARKLRPIGKALLKTVALDYLPAEVVHRPKMGFTVPSSYYLGPWPSAWIRDGFVSEAFSLDPAQLRAWITQQTSQSAAWMLTLEIWGQLFVRRRCVNQVQSEFLSAVAAA
jgi:asparagine synthase (glutamine-hydrolysing)